MRPPTGSPSRVRLDAARAELALTVVIVVTAVAVLAAIGGGVLVALQLRHGPPRVMLPPRVYGSTSVHAVQDRPEPRALGAGWPGLVPWSAWDSCLSSYAGWG
jgi:hypothetical protein